MAMAPCPECKKKISTDAPACPKCGHPIDDASRAAWVADAKKSKRIGCGLAILMFIGFFAFFYANDSRNNIGYDLISRTWDKHYSVSNWETAGLCGGLAVMINNDIPYWIDSDGTVYAVTGYTRVFSPRLPWGPIIADNNNVSNAIKNQNHIIPAEWGDYSKLPSAILPVEEASMVKRMNDILKQMRAAQQLEPLTPGGERAPGWYHDGTTAVDINFKNNSGGLARVSILTKGRGEDNRHFSSVVLAATAASSKAGTVDKAASMVAPLFKRGKEQNGETASVLHDGMKYSFTLYGKGAGNFIRYEIEAVDPS